MPRLIVPILVLLAAGCGPAPTSELLVRGDAGEDTVDIGSPEAWTSAQWVTLNDLPEEDFSFLASNGVGEVYFTGWAVALDADGRPTAIVEGGTAAQETVLKAETPAPLGEWFHLAVTWSEGDLRMYVDGAEAAATTTSFTSIPFGGIPFVAGWDANQERRIHQGGLEDVMVWDGALSPEAVAELVRPD